MGLLILGVIVLGATAALAKLIEAVLLAVFPPPRIEYERPLPSCRPVWIEPAPDPEQTVRWDGTATTEFDSHWTGS